MDSLTALRASGLAMYIAEPYLVGRSQLGTGSHSAVSQAAATPSTAQRTTQDPAPVSTSSSSAVGCSHELRIGGPLKALQPWSVLQRVDMRVGTITAAMLPQDMASKYRKISAPVFAVWSDFGAIDSWPHGGEWGSSTKFITAAKICTFYDHDALNSGTLDMVGLVNAGVKQVGKISTYYLLTGSYTDENVSEHNVARAKPMSHIANGSRLTILSLHEDGSRYEDVPTPGAPLRANLDFTTEFVDKVDARVGAVTLVALDQPGTLRVQVNFGSNLCLQSRVPLSLCPGATQGSDASETSILGKSIVGMVNVEPIDGNTFLLLGFVDSDGVAVPLHIDNVSAELPPLGSRLL